MALSSRLRCPGQGRSPRRPWNAQSVTPLWARRPLPQPAVGALSPRHLLPAALPPDDTWFRVCCVSPKLAGLPAGGRKHEVGEAGACSARDPADVRGPLCPQPQGGRRPSLLPPAGRRRHRLGVPATPENVPGWEELTDTQVSEHVQRGRQRDALTTTPRGSAPARRPRPALSGKGRGRELCRQRADV